MRITALSLAAALALSACGSTGTGPVASDDGVVRMALGPNGLLDTASGKEISFGRAQDGAITAASALLNGRPDAVTRRDCGGTPVGLAVWRNTLEMQFRGGAFVGWRAERSALPRLAPLGITTPSAGRVC